MKTYLACGLVAALSSVAIAHPLNLRQDGTNSSLTCSFDRATAFKTLYVSNPPVSLRKKRACGSKDQPALSSSAAPSVAATSRRGGRPSTSSATRDIRTSSTMAPLTPAASEELRTSTTSIVASNTAAVDIEATTVTTAASSTATSSWDPPSSLATALDEVCEHEISTYSDALGFMNYGYDHLIDTEANIQYCVRWDSTKTVTAAQRASIETALQRSYNKWVEGALTGFDGFPYSTANVKVTGWATNDTALLEGDVADGVTIYSTADTDGIPQCDEACGRFFHYTDGDYSGCSGGDAARYDVSLWLTDDMDGAGAGGDWGQRIGTNYMLENLESENIHILLHEMGHTLALDDFYDWTPTGVTSFIMNAGSATEVTEFDAWMVRDWWRNLKSRYDL